MASLLNSILLCRAVALNEDDLEFGGIGSSCCETLGYLYNTLLNELHLLLKRSRVLGEAKLWVLFVYLFVF